VLCNLENASELPRVLVTSQIAEPHSQNFLFNSSGVRLKNLDFNKLWGEAEVIGVGPWYCNKKLQLLLLRVSLDLSLAQD
jgi:hypothetical protein